MSMAMPAHPLPLLVRALVHTERPGGGRDRVRASASACTGRGVGGVSVDGRLALWWLPCAVVCSECCWVPPPPCWLLWWA